MMWGDRSFVLLHPQWNGLSLVCPVFASQHVSVFTYPLVTSSVRFDISTHRMLGSCTIQPHSLVQTLIKLLSSAGNTVQLFVYKVCAW